MTDIDHLSEQFEQSRTHLRAVAYRMLGSTAEADDAVQEAWLRLSRSDVDAVANLRGWLTTVVGRVCLDMLRSRHARREQLVGEPLPEPIVAADDRDDPEREALLADSVGLALLVVLDTLAPAERLAFVLHDMFGVPFEEIASVVGVLRPRRVSSPAGHGGGSATARPFRIRTWRGSGRSSTRRIAAIHAFADPERIGRLDLRKFGA